MVVYMKGAWKAPRFNMGVCMEGTWKARGFNIGVYGWLVEGALV